MKHEKLMLLIDADNVSVGVMEQALQLLLNQHGAVHIRRAYCTPESALKHQALFKHLGIKPMVNLAAGKNSTDIAMAVDAIDLAIAERPDVAVILSSDSDFAPLVMRLREKGCVVRGIGQQGKTGDETQGVYDDYTVLEHRAPMLVPSAAPRPRPARKTPAARKTRGKAEATASTPASTPKRAPAAKKTAARKTTRRTSAAALAAAVADALADASPLPPDEPPPATPEPVSAAAPMAPAPTAAVDGEASQRRSQPQRRGGGGGGGGSHEPGPDMAALLAVLPELQGGQPMALNLAVQRLREAGLLGKSASSIRLFARFGDRFELGPADKPSLVRLRAGE
ncbi:MAG: NYN domain-containing protein [Rubrivivax sp.]|nr:NYN domain-containing protein [Rubrivivax sp.]